MVFGGLKQLSVCVFLPRGSGLVFMIKRVTCGSLPNSVLLPCFVCKQVLRVALYGVKDAEKVCDLQFRDPFKLTALGKKSEGQDAEGTKTRENIDAVLQPNSRFWASKVPFRLSGPTKTAHHPQRLKANIHSCWEAEKQESK